SPLLPPANESPRHRTGRLKGHLQRVTSPNLSSTNSRSNSRSRVLAGETFASMMKKRQSSIDKEKKHLTVQDDRDINLQKGTTSVLNVNDAVGEERQRMLDQRAEKMRQLEAENERTWWPETKKSITSSRATRTGAGAVSSSP
ncbi:unnamed protein product, partial [Amoebophrya sp. A25]